MYADYSMRCRCNKLEALLFIVSLLFPCVPCTEEYLISAAFEPELLGEISRLPMVKELNPVKVFLILLHWLNKKLMLFKGIDDGLFLHNLAESPLVGEVAVPVEGVAIESSEITSFLARTHRP